MGESGCRGQGEMPRRKRSPLLFGVYNAFKADRNDDGGVGGRRIGVHAQTRTARGKSPSCRAPSSSITRVFAVNNDAGGGAKNVNFSNQQLIGLIYSR